MVAKDQGLVSNIQYFSTKDGPGIRTTVFLKGCNLNCQWCSNPETINIQKEVFFDKRLCQKCLECTKAFPDVAVLKDNEIQLNRSKIKNVDEFVEVCPYSAFKVIGEYYSPQDLAKALVRDLEFYEESQGGVTFSGGEPLLQSDFIISVAKELKKYNVHIAVDTTLNISSEKLTQVLPYIDLLLVDVKFIDKDLHKKYTGVSNDLILKNLKIIADYKSLVAARLIVINDVNDHDIKDRIDLLNKLNVNIKSIHLLAYHQLGMGKYLQLDKDFIGFEVKDFDFKEVVNYGEKLGYIVNIG